MATPLLGLLSVTGKALLLALPASILWIAWRDGTEVFLELEPTHVAVRIDEWSSDATLLTEPGLHVVLPFVQRAHVLDKRDATFLMQGESEQGPNHVPMLTVRSADGSEFWFQELEILYRVRPDSAERVLFDSGPADGFRQRWMRDVARAVLSEEFGRLATQESAASDRLEQAKGDALDRLQELLGEHGLEVLQITMPKPQFDRTYEKAIEDRKVLEQEAERLRGDLQEEEDLRPSELQRAEREVELERQRLVDALERRRLEAETAEIARRAAVDRYVLERQRAAEAAQVLALAEAAALEADLSADGEALRAEVGALAEHGELAVRRELIGFLDRLQLELRPLDPRDDREDGAR